ncbi:hypothetical protein ACFLTE_10885, partial [Bacteroidota bacterium]
SIKIFDQSGIQIPDSLYQLNFKTSTIHFIEGYINYNQDLRITYQVLPYNFSQTYFHKDYDKIILGPEFQKPINYKEQKSFDPFLNEKIEKSGNISRGISFGNNQDVIVNSNLNLQLTGKLDNNLNIVAAITDENIPIQPDGYTQQIQEFDKVYINVFNENINATAGDFELFHNQGYFLKANKKGQGGIATINADPAKKKNLKYKTTISGAVAKGRFAKTQLDAIEGNQGPYRLYGANNEMYIIILAGSEKVYIDGKLIKRGEDEDYIINYNSAEIIFTTNQPITKDKRITVEFEYSDRNYARFMLYNHQEIETKKGNFWINIYNEQDAKNQSLQQDLTDADKQFLSSIGDDIGKAIVPNYDSMEYSNEFVRYKREYNNQYDDTIFIYSTNPDSAIYKVGFSFVGQGNGNYVQDITAANGKVFKWISPVDGIKQGSYEPVSLLITPKKQQLITFGYDFTLAKSIQSFFEIGISNTDLNTFSSIQNDDNVGFALKTGLEKTFFSRDSGRTGLMTGIDYEFNDYKFRPVERYKPVEYERDWNLLYNNLFEREHLLSFKTSYLKNELGRLGLNVDHLNKGENYTAFKNGMHANLEKRGYKFSFSGSNLSSEDSINNTNFLRYQGVISKSISKFIIGIQDESEFNRWKNNISDSLTLNSYKFNQYKVFAGYGDSLSNYTEISYGSRLDKLPINNTLKNATQSNDFNIKHKFSNKYTTFKTGISYRNLSILDTSLSNEKKTETVTGRIENYSNFLQKVINTGTFYEVGTGLEPIKEFSYIKVVQGEGVYTWNDYNNNNVQELDEFEIANYSDEANYIRVFIPTNQYEKIFFNQFSQSIDLNPYIIGSKKKGIKKTISRFSDNINFRVSQRTRDINVTENLNPFLYMQDKSNTQSLQTSIRNSFAFNKHSSSYWFELIHLNSSNHLLLVNGIEKKSILENKLQVYYKIKKGFYINGYTSILTKKSESEYFTSKNYSIENQSNKIEFQFQIASKSQININYLNSNKANNNSEEKLTGHTIGSEFKSNLPINGTLLANAKYINLIYNAVENSPLAYEMLEGLKPGNNYTWMLSLRKNLVSGLILHLNYEGRSSEDAKVIHIGGVQLRANF